MVRKILNTEIKTDSDKKKKKSLVRRAIKTEMKKGIDRNR